MICIGCSYFAGATRRANCLEETRVDLTVLLPLSRDVIFVIDGLHRTDRLTCTAINALIRLDVQHPITLVNAINGALLDAGLVFHINTRLGDYVCHFNPFK
jgi:adenine deaminase